MTNAPLVALSGLKRPADEGTSAKPSAEANGTLFHFSLNVSNLDRSIAFYEILFGVPPAKRYADYAKFELREPPLVFSLVPNPPASGGSLSHFGFPVESAEQVRAAAARLAAAGLQTCCQEDTVCGYARQEKVWISDPDRNFWEIYVVHEDVDPESVRSSYDGGPPSAMAERSTALAQAPAASTQTIWEHRILMPLPDRVPHADGTVAEVRLEGLFNDAFSGEERRRLLVESLRVLCPGGRLQVHGLVADRPLGENRAVLPGVAALVSRVPLEREPIDEIEAAGFRSIRITKLSETAVFQQDGCEMREIKIEARKPEREDSAAAPAEGQVKVVLYKGPFATVVDESGNTFPRGRRTPVSAETWDRLSCSELASQFIFFGDQSLDERACG